MLDYIYRLMRDFEQEHGFSPNLLHLNQSHEEHVRASFDEALSLHQIIQILGMEVVIDQEIIHPGVSWTLYAFRIAS